MFWLPWNLGASASWNRQSLSRPVMGLLYLVQSGFLRMPFLPPHHWYSQKCCDEHQTSKKLVFPPSYISLSKKKIPPLFVQITRLQMSNSWRCTPVVTRHSLLSTCRAVSGYAGSLIYASMRSTAFLAPNFMKLSNAEQHYVPISHTEFHPNRTINMGSTNEHLFRPQIKVWLSRDRFSWDSKLRILHILPSTRLLVWVHERNTIKLHVQDFLRMSTWMFETCRRH